LRATPGCGHVIQLRQKHRTVEYPRDGRVSDSRRAVCTMLVVAVDPRLCLQECT
jgi:hypothetical protein